MAVNDLTKFGQNLCFNVVTETLCSKGGPGEGQSCVELSRVRRGPNISRL